jgi:hypothetical protein
MIGASDQTGVTSDPRLARILAKPGTRELLLALRDHPGQPVGALWSACGVPLRENSIRSRLATLRSYGLVEIGRNALTERGDEILTRLLAGGAS